MKIVLSYNEIAEHVRRQYNLPPDAVVVISRKKKPAPVATLTPVHSITKTGHAVPHFLRGQRNLLGQPVFDAITKHLALNKIAAIKEVRAAAGFGLKEAKDCVENWYEFHTFMLNNNRWPRLSYPFGSVDFN